MTSPTVDLLQRLFAAHGYSFFTGPEAFNLNLFGIRRAQDGVNLFNDLLGCAYRPKVGADMVVELWPGTTDPGSFYLRQPMNRGGTAIVVPDQYRGLWTLGLHHGKDPAFVQVGPVAVYRDGDRDEVLDMDPKTIVRGLFGINGHRAGTDSTRVDNWSAGCQVWKRRADHDRALELGRAQVAAHPTWKKYSYTLFDSAVDTDALALFQSAA
jgi:hypothetical protein